MPIWNGKGWLKLLFQILVNRWTNEVFTFIIFEFLSPLKMCHSKPSKIVITWLQRLWPSYAHNHCSITFTSHSVQWSSNKGKHFLHCLLSCSSEETVLSTSAQMQSSFLALTQFPAGYSAISHLTGRFVNVHWAWCVHVLSMSITIVRYAHTKCTVCTHHLQLEVCPRLFLKKHWFLYCTTGRA